MTDIKQYELMLKLRFSHTERAGAAERIERLLESFDELETADTTKTAPLVTVLDAVNALREDISAKRVSRETLLRAAPEQKDGYFAVPKTL